MAYAPPENYQKIQYQRTGGYPRIVQPYIEDRGRFFMGAPQRYLATFYIPDEINILAKDCEHLPAIPWTLNKILQALAENLFDTNSVDEHACVYVIISVMMRDNGRLASIRVGDLGRSIFMIDIPAATISDTVPSPRYDSATTPVLLRDLPPDLQFLIKNPAFFESYRTALHFETFPIRQRTHITDASLDREVQAHMREVLDRKPFAAMQEARAANAKITDKNPTIARLYEKSTLRSRRLADRTRALHQHSIDRREALTHAFRDRPETLAEQINGIVLRIQNYLRQLPGDPDLSVPLNQLLAKQRRHLERVSMLRRDFQQLMRPLQVKERELERHHPLHSHETARRERTTQINQMIAEYSRYPIVTYEIKQALLAGLMDAARRYFDHLDLPKKMAKDPETASAKRYLAKFGFYTAIRHRRDRVYGIEPTFDPLHQPLALLVQAANDAMAACVAAKGLRSDSERLLLKTFARLSHQNLDKSGRTLVLPDTLLEHDATDIERRRAILARCEEAIIQRSMALNDAYKAGKLALRRQAEALEEYEAEVREFLDTFANLTPFASEADSRAFAALQRDANMKIAERERERRAVALGADDVAPVLQQPVVVHIAPAVVPILPDPVAVDEDPNPMPENADALRAMNPAPPLELLARFHVMLGQPHIWAEHTWPQFHRAWILWLMNHNLPKLTVLRTQLRTAINRLNGKSFRAANSRAKARSLEQAQQNALQDIARHLINVRIAPTDETDIAACDIYYTTIYAPLYFQRYGGASTTATRFERVMRTQPGVGALIYNGDNPAMELQRIRDQYMA